MTYVQSVAARTADQTGWYGASAWLWRAFMLVALAALLTLLVVAARRRWS